jgi:hypothetical protein
MLQADLMLLDEVEVESGEKKISASIKEWVDI